MALLSASTFDLETVILRQRIVILPLSPALLVSPGTVQQPPILGDDVVGGLIGREGKLRVV
jgi:hypothetical protein